MWSFSTFKDKRYWTLLIPALIILVLLAVYTPNCILEKPYLSALLILILPTLFWSTYYIWKYLSDKKKKITSDDNGDL